MRHYPMVDVLFINGCDSSVPHPARYRVTHQREQLEAHNISTDEVYYIDLQEEQVRYAHVFIFFRCPHTDTIEHVIQKAKQLHKTVLFDIDDLVVDTVYTDTIKYIQKMTPSEKAIYDDGVNRMGKTLKLCQGAITTTERLATELGKYVPEVFINRNTASERMYALSERTHHREEDEEIHIGYFSGSITHNDDFQLVLPVLIRLMDADPRVRLCIVGELELPKELAIRKKQIITFPFMDWQQLPQAIASVDINIAPLEQSIFNEAKSENKWVEAALVKVPTVASRVGAFDRMIRDGETGFLCSTEEEWEEKLVALCRDKELREKIAEQAYEYVKENCLTIYSGIRIARYIREKMPKTAVFSLPSTEISGGIMVALRHASILQDEGYDVTIHADKPTLEWMTYEGHDFPVIANGEDPVRAGFDKGIGTMWTTMSFIQTLPEIKERYYLVQNYETDFYPADEPLRVFANRTYMLGSNIQYLTISRWCQKWLKEKYGKESRYVPNGIDLSRFTCSDRDFSGKIRILIEGDCAVKYKGVDESFKITNLLDRDRFEVWYMSYNANPKKWYMIDKFLHRVPYDEVPEVYRQCHILLKSSTLESFSYPPIEMMATGGYVVVVPNGGNQEYLRDGENCLFYQSGNLMQGLDQIRRLCEDGALRQRLAEGAKMTTKGRSWNELREEILQFYHA